MKILSYLPLLLLDQGMPIEDNRMGSAVFHILAVLALNLVSLFQKVGKGTVACV